MQDIFIRTVYTAGHPAEPQDPFPNDTIPAKKMNGFERFVKSNFIKGPPESTNLLDNAKTQLLVLSFQTFQNE